MMNRSISEKVIWVLEDDPGCQFVYREILSVKYNTRYFSTLEEFRAGLSDESLRPDILIADLRLQDESFLKLLSATELRGLRNTKIMIVSSVDDSDVLKICFDSGASDYLTKPFNKTELLVKIFRLLQSPIQTRSLEITTNLAFEGHQLKTETGLTVDLTVKEHNIFNLLSQNFNSAVPRTDIVKRTWGNVMVGSKTLDVHMFNIRKKIAPLGLAISFVQPNQYRLQKID